MFYEIPASLACAYLKGHLRGRTKFLYEVLGYALVQGEETDFEQLRQALMESFPIVRNKAELEARFFASYQTKGQAPMDFIYNLLKIQKVLKLEMTEQNLVEYIVNRLEPQVLDYVEFRNPTSRSLLLEVVSKFEERYSARETQGPSNSSERRDWDARWISPDDRRNRNWQDAGVIERQNDRRVTNRSAYKNRPQRNNVNQGFESRNRNNRHDNIFERVRISSEKGVRMTILTEGNEDMVVV
ncbi:uncharacterized protein TNCV_4339511 [Trichonephila clavipes]|nr:uncharacterized protein TNCV_4339511 [Trichonephila clavipes]